MVEMTVCFLRVTITYVNKYNTILYPGREIDVYLYPGRGEIDVYLYPGRGGR